MWTFDWLIGQWPRRRIQRVEIMNIEQLAHMKRLNDQAYLTLRSLADKPYGDPVRQEIIAIALATDNIVDDPDAPDNWRNPLRYEQEVDYRNSNNLHLKKLTK